MFFILAKLKSLLSNVSNYWNFIRPTFKNYFILRFGGFFVFRSVFNSTKAGVQLEKKFLDWFLELVGILEDKQILSSILCVIVAVEAIELAEGIVNLFYAACEFYTISDPVNADLPGDAGYKEIDLSAENKPSEVEESKPATADKTKPEINWFLLSVTLIIPGAFLLVLYVLKDV